MLLSDMDITQVTQSIWDTMIMLAPNFVAALLVLIISYGAAGWAARVLRRLLEPSKLGAGLTLLLMRATRISVLLLGLVAVLFLLNLHGIALSFVAGLGITGLLLAFALQEIAKNLAASLLLLVQRPFDIGDRIRLGEYEGVVHEIGLRATHLCTDDNREIMLPNASVYTGVIVNLTRYPARRYSQSIKLASGAPVSEALTALETLAQEVPGVRSQPAPEALLSDPSTNTVELRYWLPTKGIDQAVVSAQVARQLRTLIVERGWL